MADISVNELNKFYGSNHVLKGISFEIHNGERVGLLGKNGSGKTTLFKIITGEEHFESGNVAKTAGKKIEMLSQIPVFNEGDTAEDILRSSFKEVFNTYNAMKRIEGDGSSAALARYGRLMEEYERLGGYEVEVKFEKICNGMNISDAMRKCDFGRLSGGEKTRVNLARILLSDCNILLLDEPTNHLDLSSLSWLEQFLRKFSGTVVAISHDRVFLDNVAGRIIEIDNGKASFYSGNYSWYVEEKQRRFISQSQQYERQQKEIKRIEERAKWFVEQNRFTTKHHAILSRIDHMVKVDKPISSKKMTNSFSGGIHAAKELVVFDSVSKCFGDNILMDKVNLSIRKNDRIALIGANGCGKTTLLKMILGGEKEDGGVIKISDNAKIAYMPQIVDFEDANITILETFRNATGEKEEKARSILVGFHFRSEDIMKKVRTLSGGEKSRLKLCVLMQNSINLLILDEPTNHLDIESREWIEQALTKFDGAILFVSHDRYFLNKFAENIWAMEDGNVYAYDCCFEEYLEIAKI